MELVQRIGQRSSQPVEAWWRRVWRAFEAAGMSRAAAHLDTMARHYATSQTELAKELREAANWAKAQR